MNIYELFTLTDWIIISIGVVLMILIPSLIALGFYAVAAWSFRCISGSLPAATIPAIELATPAGIEAEWSDVEYEVTGSK